MHLLAYNRVRCAIVPAAKLTAVLPRVLSFTAAKRLLIDFAQQLHHASRRRLTSLITPLLAAIACMAISNRPRSRRTARQKTTPQAPLPLLTERRHLARQKLLDQRNNRLIVAT